MKLMGGNMVKIKKRTCDSNNFTFSAFAPISNATGYHEYHTDRFPRCQCSLR